MMTGHTNTIIDGLKNPAIYDHPVDKVSLIETHISWVILAGNFAYKIKKPVNLGFLDFSSLHKRRHYCERELLLNRRLSPDYYLGLVAICGDESSPTITTDLNRSAIIEFAVKMKQFPQASQLDRMLQAKTLTPSHIGKLAEKIASFHQSIAIADSHTSYGEPANVHKNVLDSYDNALKQLPHKSDSDRLSQLKHWSCAEFEKLKHIFSERKQHGFIRECHGDLHLRNIAMVNDQVVIFDGIEFNDDLLWNDVISEVAFVIMDLDDHARADFGYQLLNRYLEISGDYAGLQMLNYYLVYRAIVRAMVSCIRLSQADLSQQQRAIERRSFTGYLQLAENYTQANTANQTNCLIITHGFSGSGKTTISQKLLENLPAIRIRSDIERKRLVGIGELARSDESQQKQIYSESISQQTYQYLLQLSATLLQAGFNVIVDAAFLQPEKRQQFAQLARVNQKPFVIVDCQANIASLEARLKARESSNNDASDANIKVLHRQLASAAQFSDAERAKLVEINTEQPLDIEKICQQILRKKLNSITSSN